MKQAVEQPAKENEEQAFHWHVMQSLKHQKWVLAVVRGDFTEYQVTDVMSGNVDLMVQYADYLNKGKISPGMDGRQIQMLHNLREKYQEGKP